MSNTNDYSWASVCESADVPSMVGVRALLNGEQVAIFRIKGQLYAVSAIDPFTKMAVLARGIVGDLKGKVVVASPIYKQHFVLEDGSCLEDETVSIKTYPIRESNGKIELAIAEAIAA
ncbi:nitrite reductase small subunit NirD [Teredinibacter waterburyi]|uniref:nitrite reductase small subunit NirD n=1 Tax=Teredinibacter waterburyi TaxID=1500538 RepID=UPI00165F1C19|nr:nitrite reductase small subunit NirD [Teredinibacter waterburyi]